MKDRSNKAVGQILKSLVLLTLEGGRKADISFNFLATTSLRSAYNHFSRKSVARKKRKNHLPHWQSTSRGIPGFTYSPRYNEVVGWHVEAKL